MKLYFYENFIVDVEFYLLSRNIPHSVLIYSMVNRIPSYYANGTYLVELALVELRLLYLLLPSKHLCF